MMAVMPGSNFARFAYTTRATACDTASTEYGWRTFTNSLMTAAFPSRYPRRTPASEKRLGKRAQDDQVLVLLQGRAHGHAGEFEVRLVHHHERVGGFQQRVEERLVGQLPRGLLGLVTTR